MIAVSHSVDGIFLNTLKFGFLIEQVEDGAIYSIDVRVHEQFSNSDSIKLLLPLPLQSLLSDGFDLLGLQEIQKGGDCEYILAEN